MDAMKSTPHAAPASEPVMVRVHCCGVMITMAQAQELQAQRKGFGLSVRTTGWGMDHHDCDTQRHLDWMAVGS